MRAFYVLQAKSRNWTQTGASNEPCTKSQVNHFFQFKLAFHAFSILILNMCHLNLFWIYDICQLNFKHMIYTISICFSNKLISGRMCWVGRREISQGSNSDRWTFAALATVLIIDLFLRLKSMELRVWMYSRIMYGDTNICEF